MVGGAEEWLALGWQWRRTRGCVLGRAGLSLGGGGERAGSQWGLEATGGGKEAGWGGLEVGVDPRQVEVAWRLMRAARGGRWLGGREGSRESCAGGGSARSGIGLGLRGVGSLVGG